MNIVIHTIVLLDNYQKNYQNESFKSHGVYSIPLQTSDFHHIPNKAYAFSISSHFCFLTQLKYLCFTGVLKSQQQVNPY